MERETGVEPATSSLGIYSSAENRTHMRPSDQILDKHRTRKQCAELARRFIRALEELSNAGFAQLVRLGQTLTAWATEVAMMWRFTRNNGITEGFHTKMSSNGRPTASAISTTTDYGL